MSESSSDVSKNNSVFNAGNIIIDTLEVDYPESSERSASIFGNGVNNIPVRVRFKILNKSANDGGKNISESLKDKIYLYDVSANKGIGPAGGRMPDGSMDLFFYSHQGDYTLGFYGKNHSMPLDSGNSEYCEVVFYVQTWKTFSAQKDFQLGAYLALNDESTPDNRNISSGIKKTVSLTVMQPIDYANPSAWEVAEEGTSDIPFNDNIDVNHEHLQASDVSGNYKTWMLTHTLLADNSPVKLAVEGTGVPVPVTQLNPDTAPVASVEFTKAPDETHYTVWMAPVQGQGIMILPRLSDYRAKNHICILPDNHGLNHKTQSLSLVQVAVTVKNAHFSTKTMTHQTGTILVNDNVGHSQNLKVFCNSEDGKPAITGKG